MKAKPTPPVTFTLEVTGTEVQVLRELCGSVVGEGMTRSICDHMYHELGCIVSGIQEARFISGKMTVKPQR
jgi:hypothetical protein